MATVIKRPFLAPIKKSTNAVFELFFFHYVERSFCVNINALRKLGVFQLPPCAISVVINKAFIMFCRSGLAPTPQGAKRTDRALFFPFVQRMQLPNIPHVLTIISTTIRELNLHRYVFAASGALLMTMRKHPLHSV